MPSTVRRTRTGRPYAKVQTEESYVTDLSVLKRDKKIFETGILLASMKRIKWVWYIYFQGQSFIQGKVEDI